MGNSKTSLRRRLRGLRRSMSPQARSTASAAMCARLQGLPVFHNAATIVGYAALPDEADPAAALANAQARGARIGMPRITGPHTLAFHELTPTSVLHPGAFGIPEPGAHELELELAAVDLVLVPALAVGEDGCRLGSGKGYYDRLLPQMPRALKICTVFELQYLTAVPCEPHDMRADWVITERGAYQVSPH